MPLFFFVRRFLIAFVIAAAVISAAQFLKGHPLALAIPDGLLWGAISSAVYTLVLAYKLRRSACYAKPASPDIASQGGPPATQDHGAGG
jgi:hypothetical protein